MPIIAGLSACHEHVGVRHHVVHGRPVSVFTNPVGYSYPDIADRTRSAGYRPLPTPVQRRLDIDTPPPASTPPAPASPPKATRKQSTLAPAAPAKPTVEVVPRQDEAEGRATTQMRR